jgi:hypothetical protein
MTAAGKYTDLISVNYYSEWEPDNVKLDMWLAKGNKPFFISEFYVKGNDLGLANGNGAGWLVATQTDRAKFYENFVLKLMKHPGCAGYHWFRYIDNHQTNKGVMDSTYKWFQPMVDAFKRINKDIYRLRSQLWFGNVNYNDKIDCAGTMCGTTVASVSIALTNGLNPSCAAAPLTYTATETNGGTAPVYQWKVNGINSGTNSKTFTSSTITNSSVVTCVMTSSYTCGNQNSQRNAICDHCPYWWNKPKLCRNIKNIYSYPNQWRNNTSLPVEG